MLTAAVPEMIGGSADLTGSNNTDTSSTVPSFTPDHPGRYVHYGVREFAMATAMNGMSTHGGVIPYGGTFLTFSDYCRNGIRLAALMHTRTIFVMTHDSIGLGEDGPTHQPIEQLAALRAIPNLNVFRPADAVEALECWALALKSNKRPSLLALSRQSVPQLRTQKTDENLCARGAYVIRTVGGGERDLTILATGTEVSIAVTAAERLAREGFTVAVVSMPSWELFQSEFEDLSRRDAGLGAAPRDRGGGEVRLDALRRQRGRRRRTGDLRAFRARGGGLRKDGNHGGRPGRARPRQAEPLNRQPEQDRTTP